MEDSRNICRCCHQLHARTQSIFNNSLLDSDTVGIDAMLRTITSLEIEQNDGLPQCICLHCNSILITAYVFRERVIGVAQEYQDLQNDIFKRESEVDIEDEVIRGGEEPEYEGEENEAETRGGDDNQDEDDSEEEDDEGEGSEPSTRNPHRNKSFADQHTLDVHQTLHNEERPPTHMVKLKECYIKVIRCDEMSCKITTVQKVNGDDAEYKAGNSETKKRHVKRPHNFKANEENSSNDEEYAEGIKKKKFECEHCLKPLETHAHLVKHMRTHESAKQKYLCSECRRDFARRKDIFVHERN